MANKETTYQGWRNYSTWACALWLSCDESFDTAVHEFINELDDSNNQINELADYLENFVEELTPDLGASMYADILNEGLANIDFYEIAQNYLME